MRQAQKEREQSLDFLGVVHAPVCVLSTEGSSASAAVFPCFNTAAPCFSMEKMLPRHCSLRCFAHTQAHALHPKSRVTAPFLFVLASLFEFPIRGEYVLFYPFKSFEVNAMDFSFDCIEF